MTKQNSEEIGKTSGINLPKPKPGTVAERLMHWKWTGLVIATGYLAVFGATEGFALFKHSVALNARSLGLSAVLIISLVHLFTALFITAHDAMHGTVVPGHPTINKRVGQICLLLFAGFSFDDMLYNHRKHHKHAGRMHLDPDFHVGDAKVWPWLRTFMKEYVNRRQLIQLNLLVFVYFMSGAPLLNLVMFKAFPGLLSASVLFYYGTYLPHRPDPKSVHMERPSGFGTLPPGQGRMVAFLKCMNFCCHEEHHANPSIPWWALYDVHKYVTTKEY